MVKFKIFDEQPLPLSSGSLRGYKTSTQPDRTGRLMHSYQPLFMNLSALNSDSHPVAIYFEWFGGGRGAREALSVQIMRKSMQNYSVNETARQKKPPRFFLSRYFFASVHFLALALF